MSLRDPLMSQSLHATLQSLLSAEQRKPWGHESVGSTARLLAETADRFLIYGDPLASETGKRMGITSGEVWLETIFPSVWGLLSTRQGLLASAKAGDPLSRLRHFSAKFSHTGFAGRPAIKVLPANALESLLLPGFSGHALLKPNLPASGTGQPAAPVAPISREGGLALCLLPFNLASIGVLDIVHLLCKQQQRVIAKVSEKAEFAGPHLERILAPLIEANALRFVYGGPDVGAWLAARPEFSHIHLTGSARTAAAVAKIAGAGRMTAELGGVTLAVVFPDALLTETDRRQVARQVAFGALANNGQHCVSFQILLVPDSRQPAFK
ncbi:MAG: aldehyde dehydrogenase family protein, partial [Acidobacteria bacterium]|nr:aldehyde dehydrogenase family protein [Acidobacteriota bacterium]